MSIPAEERISDDKMLETLSAAILWLAQDAGSGLEGRTPDEMLANDLMMDLFKVKVELQRRLKGIK